MEFASPQVHTAMSRPSDKSPVVSFNMWLSLQGEASGFATLRLVWRTTRGRLTRATVVDRATAAGVDPRLAGAAYDAYCAAVGLPVPAAPKGASAD